MASTLLILAMLLSPTLAPTMEQKKDRDWKEAKILDVKYEQKHDDSYASGASGGGFTGRTDTDTWTYVVEVDGMHYELQEQNTKSSYNTGETLKFAIDKKNFYFIDPKGKEKKGDVVGRKELKKP